MLDLIVEGLNVLAFSFEFNQLCLLVQRSFHSSFSDHLANHLFSLAGFDSKEHAKLLERDVLVEFGNYLNVVL